MLAAALLAAVAMPSRAAEPASDALEGSLCRAPDWLEFYDPTLPVTGDREQAETLVDADAVESPDSIVYTLTGNVRITRADQRLSADKASFDQDKKHVEAEGTLRYQDRTLLLAGDKLVGDLDQSRTKVTPARYQLVGARGNGNATLVETLDADRAHLENADYSTCELGATDWRLYAREMWLDRETGVGRARGMKLALGEVPILYLPYARFPLDDRRQSGFLYPGIGASNDGGFDIELPYYLNLAPNYDATITPRVVGRRGLMMGGEFRYLTPSMRGTLSGTWMPNDRDADRSRGYFRVQHGQSLWTGFSLQADVRRVSDRRYFEDFGDSLTTAATSALPSSIALVGRGSWWTLGLSADSIQLTDPLLPDSAEPYKRLPRFTVEAEHALGPDWLVAGLRSEIVRFDKPDALDGKRFDYYPYVALPFETAAWFVRPELGYRTTRYDLTPDTTDTRTRSMPIGSLDAGLVFDRDVNWFGKDYEQTLEPRLYYLRVPYRDQDDLPVFDTRELTFGLSELFRTNRYAGADRQTDANQLALALSTRLIADDTGQERARLSLGQIRYFDPPRVQLPGVPVVERSESAFIAEVEVRLSENWTAAVAEQYDPKLSRTDFSSVRLQRRFSGDGVFNADYRYRVGQLEQIDFSGAFPVADNWRLIGRYDYSLRDHKPLEVLGGFEYESCCYAVRLLGRHYVRNVEGETNDAIYFELELKGLGGLGRASEQFLRKAIQGYR